MTGSYVLPSMDSRPLRISLLSSVSISILLFSGCRKAEVSVYQAPKDPVAETRTAPALQAAAERDSEVVWTADPSWETLPATQFRKGNYRAATESGETVEISVSSFLGATGGILANVNRWLGQAGREPVTESQLEQMVGKRTLPSGIEASFVDLRGDPQDDSAIRIIAATFFHAGQSWFFKMSGPTSAVEEQIEPFSRMLAGLEIKAKAPSDSQGGAATQEEKIVFDTPQGWVESQGSSLRLASLSIEKEGLPPADFAITAFPGDTGGLTANVNRWRRQIGLPAWTEAQVVANQTQFTNGQGHAFQVFDLKSDPDGARAAEDQRILAAIHSRSDKSWFFKLRGDALLLDTQRNNFQALLESVDFAPKNDVP